MSDVYFTSAASDSEASRPDKVKALLLAAGLHLLPHFRFI